MSKRYLFRNVAPIIFATVCISDAVAYDQRCYLLHCTSIIDFDAFVQRQLHTVAGTQTPFPFQGMCRNNTSNVLLDSGHVDSKQHLGVNLLGDQGFKSKQVPQCAPLATKGYNEPLFERHHKSYKI
ncbi:hypothetical protein F5X99DRAFT_303744 [Biscogniauxia marginata]|nr:hypothetical protein F5X99DRAFT_303744 [Biscogniauxia marginata]